MVVCSSSVVAVILVILILNLFVSGLTFHYNKEIWHLLLAQTIFGFSAVISSVWLLRAFETLCEVAK